MLFACPICCIKKGEPYKFGPDSAASSSSACQPCGSNSSATAATATAAPGDAEAAAVEEAGRARCQDARAARKASLQVQRAWRRNNDIVRGKEVARARAAAGLKRPLEQRSEQNRALMESAKRSKIEKAKSAESYVEKVKSRFVSAPDKYKSFLQILQDYAGKGKVSHDLQLQSLWIVPTAAVS